MKRANPTLSERSTDDAAVESALEFLRLRGDERWFLYLHLMDLHEYVYDQESARFGSGYSDIYDNSIRWTDRTIEILLDSIADLGYLENTLVIVASDHGEAFGERGFEGHAHAVYRETTEVPLILAFPFRLAEGIVVDERSRNIDVWPTVIDILGLEQDEADGRSWLPEILAAARHESPAEGGEAIAIAELDQNWARPTEPPNPTVAVVEGTLRYVRIDGDDGTVEQLFDSGQDPRELWDRSRDRPEDLARLAEIADTYLASDPAWQEVPTRELSELELGQLRALGYVVR